MPSNLLSIDDIVLSTGTHERRESGDSSFALLDRMIMLGLKHRSITLDAGADKSPEIPAGVLL